MKNLIILLLIFYLSMQLFGVKETISGIFVIAIVTFIFGLIKLIIRKVFNHDNI